MSKSPKVEITLDDIDKHSIDDDYLMEIPNDYLDMKLKHLQQATTIKYIVIEKYHNIHGWIKQNQIYNNKNWKNDIKIGQIMDGNDIYCNDFIQLNRLGENLWTTCFVRNIIKLDDNKTKILLHWYNNDFTRNEWITLPNDNERIGKRDEYVSEIIKDTYYWGWNNQNKCFFRISQLMKKFGSLIKLNFLYV